eukprot:TRINITY_DN4921_c0_g1_i2.p1 TRINITY_DN4921_c0_g1~~TRINITY_DN4921_c0_g1_i2.p1  ORF type:complete len:708 (-),score=79.76 TRINITY_DN4921_c0_g1_i2:83-2206(-)
MFFTKKEITIDPEKQRFSSADELYNEFFSQDALTKIISEQLKKIYTELAQKINSKEFSEQRIKLTQNRRRTLLRAMVKAKISEECGFLPVFYEMTPIKKNEGPFSGFLAKNDGLVSEILSKMHIVPNGLVHTQLRIGGLHFSYHAKSYVSAYKKEARGYILQFPVLIFNISVGWINKMAELLEENCPSDSKIQQVLLSVVEEFFTTYGDHLPDFSQFCQTVMYFNHQKYNVTSCNCQDFSLSGLEALGLKFTFGEKLANHIINVINSPNDIAPKFFGETVADFIEFAENPANDPALDEHLDYAFTVARWYLNQGQTASRRESLMSIQVELLQRLMDNTIRNHLLGYRPSWSKETEKHLKRLFPKQIDEQRKTPMIVAPQDIPRLKGPLLQDILKRCLAHTNANGLSSSTCESILENGLPSSPPAPNPASTSPSHSIPSQTRPSRRKNTHIKDGGSWIGDVGRSLKNIHHYHPHNPHNDMVEVNASSAPSGSVLSNTTEAIVEPLLKRGHSEKLPKIFDFHIFSRSSSKHTLHESLSTSKVYHPNDLRGSCSDEILSSHYQRNNNHSQSLGVPLLSKTGTAGHQHQLPSLNSTDVEAQPKSSRKEGQGHISSLISTTSSFLPISRWNSRRAQSERDRPSYALTPQHQHTTTRTNHGSSTNTSVKVPTVAHAPKVNNLSRSHRMPNPFRHQASTTPLSASTSSAELSKT